MSLSTTGINFSGLGSGIDTESIIKQLISLEARPLTRLQSRQAQLQNQLSLYQQFGAKLTTLQAAGDAINKAAAFNLVKSTTSDSTIATISTGSDAQPGVYTLDITKLAQAQKISSTGQTDSTTALGLSGSFLVNGKLVQVTAADSLSQIASRINSADAHAVASIVNGGPGKAYLTLTSSETGAASKLQISNVGTSTLLNDLGVLTGTTAIREFTTNGAYGREFSDPTSAVGPLLQITGAATGTIQINGTAVSLDLATDSLTSIAQKINEAAIPSVTATVETVTTDGVNSYRLKVIGSSTPTFVDNNHVLENIGVLEAASGTELLAAQDATYKLDGVSLTSASNTITSVISGATITLLKEASSANLSISRDADAIKTGIKNFVDAYNSIRDFVSSNSTFDKDTFAAGPLLGDYTVTTNMDVITASITGVVKGLEGKLNSLAVAGVSLGQDGKLSVDDGKLSDAINSKLDQVKSLFMAVGTPTDPNVQFLSSSSKTKTSTSSGFPVVVTQAATKATATSGVAQTGPSSDTETLTFNGALFGNTAATIQLGAGNSVDDTITAINSHPTIGRLLTASKDADGKLVLTASAYGSKKSFTVVSDKAAGADNSGIGATVVTATGLNVAGTINGASATGDGQVLTGDDSSPNVAGLALLITATSAGTYGNITFTKGLGASIKDVINSLTDPTTGSLTDQDKQLQTQIDQLTDDMKRIQDSLTQRESALRQQFSTMETVVSQLRNQQARISALFSGVTG